MFNKFLNLDSNELWIPNQKISGPGTEFSDKFFQPFKREIISILYNLFLTIEVEGILPNSFYEANVTLIKTIQRHCKKTTDQYFS